MKAVLTVIILQFLLIPVYYAKLITIAAPNDTPPYVFEKGKDKGIHLEIIEQALAESGHTVRFIFYPWPRLPYSLQNKNVDVMIDVDQSVKSKNVYLSVPAFTFHDYAISLSARNINITSITQLAQYRVTAFKTASIILGNKFKDIVSTARSYDEILKHQSALGQLLLNRTDIVVWDKYIFQHALTSQETVNNLRRLGIKTIPRLEYSNIFPKLYYYAAFKDKELRDQFNFGFNQLNNKNKINEIYDKYTALRSK
ncbi:substrate-binding periplasmic protein [Piscirickettsia litoralis]|uniref:Solute-binding protein family 3/N-terminal domain-containing protein n=1 Tax=Piscirickettsia litoralis TaxID=1891921 RepID=A0ABX3A6P7_9GAMM|nr:transporter substrate-binding domain-containing protein [Piscirickettsia litoralis]ODN43313.1 hypothetical protein BGC07_10745 [Piscirickettsia litoralis]